MVLESRWADAPDDTAPAPTQKASHRKVKHRTPKKKNSKDKKTSEREDIQVQERTETAPSQPRLTFSLKEKPRPSTAPTTKNEKMELLKKKIEEQRQIYQKNQHQKQQKQLLEDFLNDDGSVQWTDEDEEDEILAKLNRSLKI